MKAVMLSKAKASHLFDHVLDGFEKSHQGIENAHNMGLFSDKEELDLLRMNSQRLIERIREWKIINNITCIFFAVVFALLQINGDQLELRKPGRTSSGRRQEAERVDDGDLNI
jgi:hypothetical protein